MMVMIVMRIMVILSLVFCQLINLQVLEYYDFQTERWVSWMRRLFDFYFGFDFDFVDYKEVIRWGVLAEKPDWVFGAEMAACKGRFFLILDPTTPHFLMSLFCHF